MDSELGKRQLIESYGIDAAKVFVLPYVAPSWMYRVRFARSRSGASEVRTSRRNTSFYPAQFYKHKNHSSLLEAIARLKSTLSRRKARTRWRQGTKWLLPRW